jgi:hypothetical protein
MAHSSKTCIIVRDTPTLETHYKADIKLQNGETIPIEIIDTAGKKTLLRSATFARARETCF